MHVSSSDLALLSAMAAAVGAALGVLALRWREAGRRNTGGSPVAVARSPSDGEARARSAESSRAPVRDRRLGIVADSVPDAVVLFSEVGTIQYANPVARDLFFEGRVPEGQNFIRLVTAASAPLREALLGETDRFFSVEVDGRLESFHLSRRTFEAEDETLTLLVVKYMTREIHRRELEVLERVVRVISHEVNNSLAPISSLMHSARMVADKMGHADKYQRIFDTIDERASHLRTFLAGYAALARLPRPRCAEVDWKPLLEQLAALYPGVRLPPPPAAPGWFDKGQIEQVLINLLKNALEAGSPAPAIEVEIATLPDGASEIDVRDRGPGFTPEAMQNARVPLYTTKAGGSGMGLSLSHEIALAHGGSLDVSNRVEGGACVRVRLAGKKPPAAGASRSRLTLTRS